MKKLFKSIVYFLVIVVVLVGIAELMKPKITLRMYELSKEAFLHNFNKKFVRQEVFKSTNSLYILEVYKEVSYKPLFSLSSEQEFAEAYVVLKDKRGKVLLEPHWYASCDFIISDLQVEWQDKVSRVYFTKFNYIDLTTMSFDCY